MKTNRVLLGVIAITLLATIGTVLAKPTSTQFTLTYNLAQFQWRAFGGPFGAWSSVYQNSLTTDDLPYILTGNSLKTTITFSPIVTNVQGASTNYVYDKTSKLWIQHEGTITYDIPNYYCSSADAVCTGPYVSYWRGYLDFGGNTPSELSFVHGVVYQWVYYYSAQDDPTVALNLPNAVWDQKVGAWLIGFSIYFYDKGPQNYNNLIETLTVPAKGETPTYSVALTTGVEYELKASGTATACWEPGCYITFDAEYSTSDGTNWVDGVAAPYDGYGSNLLDLMVNGVPVDWGTYNSAHEYSLPITGTGLQLSLLINDVYYPNNGGSLTVDIYGKPVLFPSPFIEPVPANNFNPLGL